MTALQDYAILQPHLNGNAMVQITSCEHVTESGQTPVELLNEGLGGFSPGSGHCEYSIGYVVPIGGPEVNVQAICVDGEYVDMQLFLGPLQYAGRGKILSHRVSKQTGQPVEGSFNWYGELKKFE